MQLLQKFFQSSKIRRLAKRIKSAPHAVNTNPRREAAEELVAINTTGSTRVLLETLKDLKGWEIESWQRDGVFAKIGSTGIVPLADVLVDDTTPRELRDACALTLEVIGDSNPNVSRTWASILVKDSKNLKISKMCAARALGSMQPPTPEAISSLTRNLDSGDNDIDFAIETALRRIGVAVVPTIVPILKDSKRRRSALRVLRGTRICDQPLIDCATQEWQESYDPYILELLVELSPQQALALIKCELSSDEQTRVGSQTVFRDALAAWVVARQSSMRPELETETREIIAANVERHVSSLEVEIPALPIEYGLGLRDRSLENRIIRLAYYGVFARPVIDRVQALVLATESWIIRIWLNGLLACLAEEPALPLQQLFDVLRAAETTASARTTSGFESTLLVLNVNAQYGIADTARRTLKRISSIAQSHLEPAFQKLRGGYEYRVEQQADEWLRIIEQSAVGIWYVW